ncbi:MAG: TolC family protein [Candidatus Azobacteroides sp.]|nr:TolC family protein [Candidatus Azobacteroides sp.]
MKPAFITLFYILTVFSSRITAQEKALTLDECIRYAIENSLRKNKQEEQNRIYHQNYLEAVGRVLPSLGASANAYFNFGRNLNEDNTYSDVNSFNNSYNLGASITLFDGLANINRIKMQKVNRLMGKEQLRQIKDEVAYETMEAFFNVLYYKQMVELAKEQLIQSTENVRQVKRMEELGVKGFPDVAEMQAKEAQDNYNLTQQKNLLIMAVMQLKEKMNFPVDEELDIADYLSETLIAKNEESVPDIFHRSLSYLPKALAADANLKSYQLAYNISKGNLFPAISLDAGISTDFYRIMDGSIAYTSFKEQIKNKRGQYIGFTLSIPLFNGFSGTADVKRNKSQMMIARYEKDETERAIYSEIEQAVADMNGQADEYYQAKKQTEAMTVAHRVNERMYKEGLISALDLHTGSNRLFQAKVEELNARLKFYLKQKLVNYYKGEPFVH